MARGQAQLPALMSARSRRAATERQMAGFSDDCLGGHAPLHELRKRLDTSLVPLVARVEHGDERPGVE